jgi:sugar phosphate isomerase/epimerase
MLHLALSCLQGRPMSMAFDSLRKLGPMGIQLTPGNLVTEDFEQQVARSGLAVRTHHGFSFTSRKTAVWGEDGRCLVDSQSVHPDKRGLPAEPLSGPALETMYPGESLGTGEELERAMREGRRLAVDVSHVYIQTCQGVISAQTWRRLMDYERIVEVHVSANDGRSDSHRPIGPDTFGLDWAKAKGAAGTPVILESYFHKLDEDQRRRQLDRLRG